MDLKHVFQLFLLTITIRFAICFIVEPVVLRKNELLCKKLTKTRSFQDHFITGPPWRTYYTWVVRLDNTCLDLLFRTPSNYTIKYFEKTYGDLVPNILPWKEATLLAYDEEFKLMSQMLMIPKKGSPGRFNGIFDVLQGDPNSTEREQTLKEGIAIFKFAFKLFRKGLFLLRWDCIGGIGHLMARPDTVTKVDVLSMVKALNFTRGHLACANGKTKKKTEKPKPLT
ncbi:uncharacterized protein LOC128679211 [Plodia interpunctella]|uniref:uncharacterized protein LOC128679211 n=1 Tax=Plodia interpunctella TaxID=58824 RepID=UPI002367EF93|nr:uncharacterized protein LOC128679211 [Plodia interpunctella]